MKKILIVDDSPDWINTHTFALKYHLGNQIEIDSVTSAKGGYQLIVSNLCVPYDIIITDLSMENDFTPLYAGEWLIKQIQFFKEYDLSRIFITSSIDEISKIAGVYGVNFIPKDDCENIMEYAIFTEIN